MCITLSVLLCCFVLASGQLPVSCPTSRVCPIADKQVPCRSWQRLWHTPRAGGFHRPAPQNPHAQGQGDLMREPGVTCSKRKTTARAYEPGGALATAHCTLPEIAPGCYCQEVVQVHLSPELCDLPLFFANLSIHSTRLPESGLASLCSMGQAAEFQASLIQASCGHMNLSECSAAVVRPGVVTPQASYDLPPRAKTSCGTVSIIITLGRVVLQLPTKHPLSTFPTFELDFASDTFGDT